MSSARRVGLSPLILRQVTDLQEQDNYFFEEYKRLERLCCDIYNSQEGLKDYLADMEGKEAEGRICVQSWVSDYRMLKHIKHVRNLLSHNPYDYSLSEAADLDFVHDFYTRILDGSDPLTMLRKAAEAEKAALPCKPQAPRTKENASVSARLSECAGKSMKRAAAVLIAIGVGLLILMLYCYYAGVS